jgi:MFS family permease
MAIDSPHWLLWLPHPQLSKDEKPYEKRWFALPAVSLAVFLIALDITIVGIAAPSIIKELGATSSQIQWSFDAYTVTLAGFVVLAGALADRFGRKGILQTGCALFAAGAAISGLAGNVTVLLAGHVISGFGAALVFPSALSIVSTLFPPNERHRAISIFARQLGGSIGVAVLGSLASAVYRVTLDLSGFDLTAGQRQRIFDSLAGVVSLEHELESKMAGRIDAMADAAMVDGLVCAMVLGAIVCAGSAALSAYLLRKRA